MPSPAHPLLDPALDTLDALWAEWEREGRPATTKGSTGQTVGHPLIAMIREQTQHVMALLPRAVVDGVDGVPVWPSHRPLPGGHEPGAAAEVLALGARGRKKTA
jgi:hypothetical protein